MCSSVNGADIRSTSRLGPSHGQAPVHFRMGQYFGGGRRPMDSPISHPSTQAPKQPLFSRGYASRDYIPRLIRVVARREVAPTIKTLEVVTMCAAADVTARIPENKETR